MSVVITAFGQIEGNAIHITHRKDFDREVGKHKNKHCIITVETGSRRNLQQNAYYWLMNGWIAKQLAIHQWGGWTADDVHEHNKLYCNAKKVTVVTKHGEIIDEEIAQSTKKLSISAFAEFIEKCKIHWATQGIYVPDTFNE